MGHSPSGGCHRLKATQLWCLNTCREHGETGGMQAQDKNKEQCDSSYGCGCLDAWRSSERTRGCCYRALCSGSEKISLWVIISWWRVGLGHPTVIRKWVLLSWSISWSPKIANRGFYRRLGSLTSARRPPHGDARNLGGFWRVGRKKMCWIDQLGQYCAGSAACPFVLLFWHIHIPWNMHSDFWRVTLKIPLWTLRKFCHQKRFQVWVCVPAAAPLPEHYRLHLNCFLVHSPPLFTILLLLTPNSARW